MFNEYIENLRREFREFYEVDVLRARAAEGQIRKILGPLTDEEEGYLFSRETAPATPTKKAKAAGEE